MRPLLGALASGLLFGLGLAVSGMVDPAVVLGFLDFGGLSDGRWNPALLGVMVGAIPTAFLLYRLAGEKVPPPSFAIDRRLVLGALLFVIPMLGGMGLVTLLTGRS